MPSPPLPTEVLAAVICQCISVANIVLVSRSFAAIAYSIPHLWSFVHLGPRQFTDDGLHHLASRLCRVSNKPLDIVIGPLSSHHEAILLQLCAVIAKVVQTRSITVSRLDITAQTSKLAEITFRSLPTGPFRFLSVSVHSITTFGDDSDEADSLNNCLTDTFESDQNILLEELSLSGCLPDMVQEESMTFLPSLRTLVFDETRTEVSHHPYLEALILSSAPQLQTISIRQAVTFSEEESDQLGLPCIYLQNLSRLELTTGLACQLLPVLAAVGLEELVLDGAFIDEDEGVNTLLGALQQASLPNLCHLAFASDSLDEEGWEWLFFQGPPFPTLEHISLIAIDEPCGFNNNLLHQHAQEPVLPLRHLTVLQCQLELDGGALLHAFTTVVQWHADCTIEYDGCLDLESGTEQELDNIGVQLQFHEENPA
jgi:hypothetical protein